MKTNINEVEINGIKYIPKDSQETTITPLSATRLKWCGEVFVKETVIPTNEDGLKAVLIRSYAAGVHFGYLKDEKFTEAGKVVTLVNTRRVWYWDGAASLSQMALEGVKKPENCKFSVVLPENEIVNVIETIPLSEYALNNLYKIAIWKQ